MAKKIMMLSHGIHKKYCTAPISWIKKIPTALKIQCTCGLLLENLNQCKPTPQIIFLMENLFA